MNSAMMPTGQSHSDYSTSYMNEQASCFNFIIFEVSPGVFFFVFFLQLTTMHRLGLLKVFSTISNLRNCSQEFHIMIPQCSMANFT